MKANLKRVIYIIVLLIGHQAMYAQHDHESSHDLHDHASWEIGIATGIVNVLTEDVWTWGLHLHAVKGFEKVERWRLGAGAEMIFDEHTHLSLNAIVQYQIFGGLGLSVSPGVLFINEPEGWETFFSSHFELMYEFELNRIHVGPLVEYSYSRADQHLLFGVHLGFEL